MSLKYIIKRIFNNSSKCSYRVEDNDFITGVYKEEVLPKTNSDYNAQCSLHTSSYKLGKRGSFVYDKFDYNVEIETTGKWMIVQNNQLDVLNGRRISKSTLFIECFIIHPFTPLGYIREEELDIKVVFKNECSI